MRLKAILAVLVVISGCGLHLIKPNPEVLIEQDRSAVMRMLADDSSCTAFHIGNGLVVSAAHCLGTGPGFPEITLIDSRNFRYYPNLIAVNTKKDLIIMRLYHYSGPKLDLWDNNTDGDIPLGSELLALGFPGYFGLRFTFELGHFRGSAVGPNGIRYILSKDLSMPGYSGGPIISLDNGKVVGITHVMLDATKFYNAEHHQHAWISMAISAAELQDWLRELNL